MKLGKIFKKLKQFWVSIVIIIAGLILIFVLKPWDWLGKIIPSGKYDKLAYEVFLSMWRWGTDENYLFELLAHLNTYELEKVFESFGTRGYGKYGGNGLYGKQLNLFQWFDKELNGKEIAQMREIWAITDLEITF